MTCPRAERDRPGRLIQAGDRIATQLVRIDSLDADNRYLADPVRFDDTGATQLVGTDALVVTNLAEPTNTDGQLPAGTETFAIDVEGHWIICVPPPSTSMFLARVVTSLGGAAYTIREQTLDATGQPTDPAGATDLTATNLPELVLGPGGGVDDDAIVLVTSALDTGTPPTVRYIFDHSPFAKYLD